MMQNVKIIFATVLKDGMEFLSGYFYAGLWVGGVSAFLYFVILVCKDFFVGNASENNAIRKIWKIPFIALLGFYGYIVLGITILSREEETEYILNLVPFSTWGTGFWHLKLWIENILMLVPLGILLYILWKPCRKIGWSLLTGLLCSLTIECLQLFGRLGKFEVDDIMNNVLGMLIGFGICKGAGQIFLHLCR